MDERLTRNQEKNEYPREEDIKKPVYENIKRTNIILQQPLYGTNFIPLKPIPVKKELRE